MTLYDKRRKKLIDDLRNKEYRDAFVAEHIYTGIPFQIKALREQKERNWTQKDLGQRTNMAQERISVLENPENQSLSIKTLLRLASAFDIALLVRYVPISDLVKWELGLDTDSLNAVSYVDDPYFKEEPIMEIKKPTSEIVKYSSPPDSNVIYVSSFLSKSVKQTTAEEEKKENRPATVNDFIMGALR